MFQYLENSSIGNWLGRHWFAVLMTIQLVLAHAYLAMGFYALSYSNIPENGQSFIYWVVYPLTAGISLAWAELFILLVFFCLAYILVLFQTLPAKLCPADRHNFLREHIDLAVTISLPNVYSAA